MEIYKFKIIKYPKMTKCYAKGPLDIKWDVTALDAPECLKKRGYNVEIEYETKMGKNGK